MEEDKVSKFILELIKKTKKKDLIWVTSTRTPSFPDGGERHVDLVYETTISDKKFRIYKYQIKLFRDEYEYEWSERIKLEAIDGGYNVIYEVPYQYSLFNLYETVREQTSGIEDLIDTLLT